MKDKKIVVLLGGPSKEAEVSRRTGNAIAEALVSIGYNAVPLELSPLTVLADIQALKGDIVFNAIHGKFGEDGALQGLLEMAEIPYTGSGIMAHAVGMNKKISKDVFRGAHIPTADYASYDVKKESYEDVVESIKQRFTFPVVVKAATQGSSIGVVIVQKEEDLMAAVKDVTQYDTVMIAEQYVAGREFTVSVLNGKSLPAIEIRPHSGEYDYSSKYTSGATDYLVPAPIDEKLAAKMAELGELVFAELQCSGAIRLDLMMDEKENLYALEYNTIPGMTATSLVPKAANAVGMDFPALCEAILQSAGIGKF